MAQEYLPPGILYQWLREALSRLYRGDTKRENDPDRDEGDHLENTETKYKLELGRAWQNMAGSSFRYYMVFQSKDLNLNGAIQFDKFCELMKNL